MYTGGFYTYSIFALIFWETRRADFGVSMGHHVATLILIVLSYVFRFLLFAEVIFLIFSKHQRLDFYFFVFYCRFARVGSVVLALHDASDVFLEVGKMSKYGGYETVASTSFVLFALSWVILRLIYYPFWIIRSTRSVHKLSTCNVNYLHDASLLITSLVFEEVLHKQIT